MKTPLEVRKLTKEDYEYVFVFQRGDETSQLPSPKPFEKKLGSWRAVWRILRFYLEGNLLGLKGPF